MNLRERVFQILREAPQPVIENTAGDVIERIVGLELDGAVSVADVAWLLAMIAYPAEPEKSRVHTVTMTDAIGVGDGVR